MTRGLEIVGDAWRLFAPPREVSVSEWADDHLYLSPEYSAFFGKFTAHAYQREPMDAISRVDTWQVVIKGAVQMLKTIAGQAMIAWAIDEQPGPILVVSEREDDADDFMRERIEPMIRDTPRLAAKVYNASTKKRRKSVLRQKYFRGGMLRSTFASRPGNLARMAARYLICEEEDKWVASAGGRGDPFGMALGRMDTYATLKKVLRSSSPSREGSAIDKAYQESDRRELYVPCPHCGAMQSMMGKFFKCVMEFVDETLPTVEAQAAAARYHCESCQQPWTDQQRQDAVSLGQWRAHAPFAGIAGFWISSLYSPWKRLAEIVLEYLRKKDDPLKLMQFTNERLAENFQEKGDAPEWRQILYGCEDYPARMVPRGGLLLTGGGDVQGDRIEAEIVAWGRRRESWSIDYQIFWGDTTQQDVWDKFWKWVHAAYPTAGGSFLPVARFFLDTGYLTHSVYWQVRQFGYGRVIATKGAHANAVMPVSQPRKVDITMEGEKIGDVTIRHVNGNTFKHELYADLKHEAGEVGRCHFPKGEQFYGEEHFRQLCSEQLVTTVDRRGRVERIFKQTRNRNEVLDCRIQARGAAYDLGMDRFQERHWAELEAQLQAEFELEPMEPPVEEFPASTAPAAKESTPPPAALPSRERPVQTSARPAAAAMRRPGIRVVGRISL